MLDVTWGKKQTRLIFDRYPYPNSDGETVYESEIVNVAERFIEDDDVAIDVGACIGYHTCLLAKLVGEQGYVYAFEPQAKSFEYLKHHVFVANELKNVACLRAVIWRDFLPEIKLWSPADVGYSSIHRYLNSYEEETVQAIPLDFLIPDDHHPRFIKIDVEGSELGVLQGAQEILKRGVDCVVLELNYHILELLNQSDQEIRQYMASLGYEMFVINIADKEHEGEFIYPIKVATHVPIKLEGGHHMNVMFSTEEKVRQRWAT